MLLVKILKRKDASSVLVAVLIALVLWQPLAEVTARLSTYLSGLPANGYGSYYVPNGDWKGQYAMPVVSVIVQLLLLEILCWVYVFVKDAFKKK